MKAYFIGLVIMGGCLLYGCHTKQKKGENAMNMDKILDRAIEKDASDVHLICGNKPMLRIARELVPIEEMEVLTVDDMNEMYDFLVRGNVDKDELFNTTRKLDTSYEYNGIRLRVNISLSDDIPLCTLRLIKNQLPTYESLGVKVQH